MLDEDRSVALVFGVSKSILNNVSSFTYLVSCNFKLTEMYVLTSFSLCMAKEHYNSH